jgi:SPOR domain
MRRIIWSATIWLLLLGNLTYFVWAQGVLAPFGFGKTDPREPQRVTRQLLADHVEVVGGLAGLSASAPLATTSQEIASGLAASAPPTSAAIAQLASQPAPAPLLIGPSAVPATAAPGASVADANTSSVKANTAATSAQSVAPDASTPVATPVVALPSKFQCMQTAILDRNAVPTIRRSLETRWPAGTWKIVPAAKPGRWLVYMGKYPNVAALEKKQQELRALKIRFFTPKDRDLMPGLVLGEYASRAKANNALVVLGKAGIKSAKVVEGEPGKLGFFAVFPAYSPQQQALFEPIKNRVVGPLVACDKDTPR